MLDASRCGPEGPCGDTWPRSTPCTGPQTPSESSAADLLGAGQHRGVMGSDEKKATNMIFFLSHRLMVSASQDGKLIVWDTYTTNKVGVRWLLE